MLSTHSCIIGIFLTMKSDCEDSLTWSPTGPGLTTGGFILGL